MEAKSKGRTVRTEADWREIMTRFAASGRTMAAFCRAEGISRSTFDVWRDKLRSKKPQKKLPTSPPREFIEVTPVPAPAISGWTVEIELPDGRLARLRGIPPPQGLIARFNRIRAACKTAASQAETPSSSRSIQVSNLVSPRRAPSSLGALDAAS